MRREKGIRRVEKEGGLKRIGGREERERRGG